MLRETFLFCLIGLVFSVPLYNPMEGLILIKHFYKSLKIKISIIKEIYSKVILQV